MNLIHHIRTHIADALSIHGITSSEIHIEYPVDMAHGDIALTLAMARAKQEGQPPRELAELYAATLRAHADAPWEYCEVAGSGFINLKLSRNILLQEMMRIFSTPSTYGMNTRLNGNKVLVEHSSPNLFKPFHIGHLMNNTIGESLHRIARFSGGHSVALSYPSDVSLGIGKAIWWLMNNGGKEALDNHESLQEKILFLGSCYVSGTRHFDESPDSHGEIREITRQIFEAEHTPAYELYAYAKELNVQYFQDITERIGSTFDSFIFESEAGKTGEDIVRHNTPDIFTESQDAIIYEGEQDGLHTRVFINKEGYPTYEAKDIGLLSLKFERYNPDLSILITDHEQKEYYKVVLAAAARIVPEWKYQSVHVTHGRMTLLGKKMSSRLGGVPTAVELIENLRQAVSEKNNNLSDKAYDAIALSALKFSITKTQAGKNINFDPNQSLSFEGDSGPYLQYTYARIMSLLAKAKEHNLEPSLEDGPEEIFAIERYLYRFPQSIEKALDDYSPHHIAHFLLEVAHVYNSWYAQTKIIDDANTYAPYHLALAYNTAQVLRTGLYLLGIEVLDEM